MFKRFFTSARNKLLLTFAEKVAKDARLLAKTQRMKENITVNTLEGDDGSITITIGINNIEEAPEAMAYEFGSGLFGPTRRKYIIQPKEGGDKEVLSFMFPEAMNIGPGRPPGSSAKQVVSDEGKAFFTHVEHPGVKPEPFLAPALEKNMDTLFGKLVDATVESIAESLGPKVEIIK